MPALIERWWLALKARLGALANPRQLDRELQEEMRFHFERQVDKYMLSGMSRRDAEREANRALGNRARIQEEHRDARGLRWLDELRQDAGHGIRRLASRPWISASAILTLAVGVGAVTTIYSAVLALVLEPLPVPAIDEVVVLGEMPRGRELPGEGWAHQGDFGIWRNEPVFEAAAGLGRWFVTMTGTEEPAEVIGYQVYGDYLRVMGIEPAIGRGLATDAARQGSREVVLSHRFWKRHFVGDPEVLGQAVLFAGSEHVIVGVMPREAGYPMGTDAWASPPGPVDVSDFSGRARLAVVARLAEGVSVQQARAALRLVGERTAATDPEGHADAAVLIEPIRNIVTYGTGPLLTILMAAAGFLLLLVCANVANVQLMHGTVRRPELALRAALGAPRGRLVRQLLAESTVLALASGLLAGVVAFWGSNFLRAGLSGEWSRYFFVGASKIGVNADVLLFSLAVSLLSVIAFGLPPALRAARVDPAVDLDRGRAASVGRGPRGVLVVLEMALSVVIVTGALVTAQAGASLAGAELGLDAEVATFTVRARGQEYRDPVTLRQLNDEALVVARATPGVASAAATNRMPAMPPGRGVELETRSAEGTPIGPVNVGVVSDGFFSTVGIPLVAGRGFVGGDDLGAARVAVVSQTVADELEADGELIGTRVRLEDTDEWLTVVGVAADVTAWNSHVPTPAVYLPAAQRPPQSMVLLMQADGTAAELARSRLRERHPDVPLLEPRTIEEAVAEQSAPTQMVVGLMRGFAAVGLLICLGGIHALVGYLASLRMREVGVHMAIGADRRTVLRLFVMRGVKLAGVGLLIGLPAAFAFGTGLTRLMAGFMPSSVSVANVPFGALGGSLLLLSALASYLPARRAASVDPAAVLRAE